MVAGHVSAGVPVLVAGLGACTPLGHGLWDSAAAARTGMAAFVEHPFLVDRRDEPIVVSPAPYLGDDLGVERRILELARQAALEAVLGLASEDGRVLSVPVLVGLPEARPGLPADTLERIATRLREALAEACGVTELEAVPHGHAAGLIALEAGWQRIRSGRADLVLVGGVDSYIDPDALEWLEACEQLRSAVDNAWGFVPGEAAGFCLLASPRAARRYGIAGGDEILAVATAREVNRIKTPTVCIGEGLTNAFRRVFAAFADEDARVDQAISDLNGEPYRADEFGFALLRISERFAAPGAFSTPADCWGDVGAASGPLHLALAVAAAKKGYADGPLTLLSASSEGGERAAALVRAGGTEER
jgi:3-oxoacyl-[acyl-carrier-protein] synthase-1